MSDINIKNIHKEINFIHITKNNICILEKFVSETSDEEIIDYFSTFEHVKNHFITLIVEENGINIGYCHIIKNNNEYWFGIHIINGHRNKGNGSKIMNYLLSLPEVISLGKICLSVEMKNTIAIKLYHKFNFKICCKIKDSKMVERYIMMKNFGSE